VRDGGQPLDSELAGGITVVETRLRRLPAFSDVSRSVGSVVAEETIHVTGSFVLTCPCPGHPGESVEFEFVALGEAGERRAARD
jgi:hypothetical protein